MVRSRDTRPTQLKVKKHRERLRAQGLRPVQIWVPDVRTAAFKAEASRQSALVAANPNDADDQAFIEAASEGVWDNE